MTSLSFKKILSLVLNFCMVFALTSCVDSDKPDSASIDATITVSPLNASTNNGGVFEGWGTSLCWWANRLGYSDSLAQKSADLFFGDNGLRMNIMRYNIGGGDDPKHNHITRTDSAIPGWLYWDESSQEYVYDYSADSNQLNVLRRAYEAAGEDALVEVFSNSPPYFMTVSGCSSGNTDPNANNLKDDSYGEFADYLAHVTSYIQNEMGIKVASVSPMNEPNTNFWGANSYKQEGCHFDAGKLQSRIIELTSKSLRNYGLVNVIVAASDETSTSKQIDEYKSYSREALNALGRVNTHTYDIHLITELGQLAKKENFVLWMSEVDGNGTAGENAGEMGAAIWFSKKIVSDINALSPSAWVMWQAIDSHISEEGYNGRTDSGMVDIDGGYWGLAVADHDNDNIILTQKYYAMGQFTRYIRPGYTLISCSGDALAAYDKNSKTLVIVAINPTATEKTVNFDLSQFKAIGGTVKAVRTSGNIANGEQWAELDDIVAYSTGFVAELKANSVTTYIMDGVEVEDVSVEEIPLDGATVTSSMPWNNSVDVAANVIDGRTDTFFDGVQDGWIEIDLGEKTEFDIIGFVPRTSFESRMVEGRFYGSNNGKDWTELYCVTQTPASGMNYAFMSKTRKYRYIRYDIPEGSDEYFCNIAEIKLYRIKK